LDFDSTMPYASRVALTLRTMEELLIVGPRAPGLSSPGALEDLRLTRELADTVRPFTTLASQPEPLRWHTCSSPAQTCQEFAASHAQAILKLINTFAADVRANFKFTGSSM
jgi:hypothetical protein